MAQSKRKTAAQDAEREVTVDAAVRVYPDTPREITGWHPLERSSPGLRVANPRAAPLITWPLGD